MPTFPLPQPLEATLTLPFETVAGHFAVGRYPDGQLAFEVVSPGLEDHGIVDGRIVLPMTGPDAYRIREALDELLGSPSRA